MSTATSDGIMICGGHIGNIRINDCYLLTTAGHWLSSSPMQPMLSIREVAAAVSFGGGWLVTGGTDGARLSTSELFYNKKWQQFVDLPEAVQGHCLVKLNETHLLMAGGYTDNGASSKSYVYSQAGGFTPQPDMITARHYHACTLFGDNVFAVGGDNINKVEYFSLSSPAWHQGPSLPVFTVGGEFLIVDDKPIFLGGVGNKKIFHLEKISALSIDWWQWLDIGEISTERAYFGAVKWNMAGCENWNT